MSAEQITAYLEGRMAPSERETFERHLVVCADCRSDLAAASETVGATRGRWLLVGAPVAAAAALLLWLSGPGLVRDDTAVSMRRGPQAEVPAALTVVSPSDGSTASVDSLVFRWRSAGPDAHYVFTITDTDGDVVHTTSTSDTAFTLPRSVGLAESTRYYWYVDALLEGAESITTGVHEFVIGR